MTEKFNLPKGGEVIDSDWHDDVDYETYGTPKEEMEYVPPESIKKENIEKLKSINLRPLFKARGHRIADLAKQVS